jgi:hypothetical protein
LYGGSVRRKAATYKQNKRIQIFIPRLEFQPKAPVLERAKTVHALDCAAIVVGLAECTEEEDL